MQRNSIKINIQQLIEICIQNVISSTVWVKKSDLYKQQVASTSISSIW